MTLTDELGEVIRRLQYVFRKHGLEPPVALVLKDQLEVYKLSDELMVSNTVDQMRVDFQIRRVSDWRAPEVALVGMKMKIKAK